MAQDRLTTKYYWVHGPDPLSFGRHSPGHGLDNYIREFIPANPAGSVIEIGSFPGPHLATFGDLGYTLSGIDFHPANETAVPHWLQKEGFKTGEFMAGDFFETSLEKKYDVVASFGFIEHFKNFEEVILLHAALVKETGYLIITTPNFRGFIQYMLHKTFDKSNLAVHNLESMRPKKWAKILSDNGFEIITKGYFGNFWFWHGAEKHGKLKKAILRLAEHSVVFFRKVLWFNSSAFSAYCGIVAKKKIPA